MKDWKMGIDCPNWANDDYKLMIQDYLLEGETPALAYIRVADSAANELGKPEMAKDFLEDIWKGWLCLSSPVLANSGTIRGLPISCFGIHYPDSTSGIGLKYHELMMMSKVGGGVGQKFTPIRPAGTPISDIGTADGSIPFMKISDTIVEKMKQGKVRKAAGSANLNIEHPDFFNGFLDARRGKGDISLQFQKIHQCAVIDDTFMEKVADTKSNEFRDFARVVRTRIETGEPFILYADNANKTLPAWYKNRGFKIDMTNICTEIMLMCDEDHSFVCCLSSVNLSKYHEWKDTGFIKRAIYFLDGVMSEFIRKAKNYRGLEAATRFAEKSRALGLGVLGWHTFLIQENLPFTHYLAKSWTNEIFGYIKEQAEEASVELAEIFGEPEWMYGYGRRNSHLLAIAPTTSNAILSGGKSPNHEPYKAVYWAERSAKGLIYRKIPMFEKLLDDLGENKPEVWSSILKYNGSVQHLKFLNADQKKLYLSFVEIDQKELLIAAGIRQTYIDQGMSLNLAFPLDTKAVELIKIHYLAWKLGLKTLYYLHSNSALSADLIDIDNCGSCDG